MANTEGVAGVDSYLLYGEESTFGTAVTANTHFGLVRSFTPRTTNNNHYSRGFAGDSSGRNVQKIVAGKAEHTLGVEFEVLNWFFFEYVVGARAGTDPYTYTESDSPPSITVVRSIVNPGASSTDRDEIWAGCVVNSATIKCSVGEPVVVTLDIMGAKHSFDTSVTSSVALPTDEVYNFSGGSIELPNGSVLGNIIDSVEITITNNYEMLWGLGSRIAQNARPKSRDYKIRFSVKYLDNDLLTAVLGAAVPGDTTVPTEYASIELNFVQGNRSAAILFDTFVFDDLGGKENQNEILGEDLSGTAEALTSLTEDNTA